VPSAGEPAGRRVLIAGGGPAGLEAARVAALRGYEVVLAERGTELGGLARQVSLRVPNAPGMREGTDWLESEVRRLGVDVRLGVEVDAAVAREVGADVVLVATGGVARRDGVQSARPGQLPYGLDRPGVVTPQEALALTAEQAGSTAVVVDDTGDYAAIGISEYLVELGVDVTVVTPFFSLASPLDPTFRPLPALSRLARDGRFRVRPTSLLAGVGPSDAVVTYLPTSTDETIAADTVVLVTRMRPANGLLAELEQAGVPAVAIGDAATPRSFRSAIADGYRWESLAPVK
jgi:NADPH-dependent 2,4-dienoyl-CoA reductase/sulfur reductase-like enzyme